MVRSKNTLTLSLMCGSIVLVLILQGFWLKSSYKDALESFRQETGFLFRGTVMKMQDSLIRENIEQVPGDSLFFHTAEPGIPDREANFTYSKPSLHTIGDYSDIAIIISRQDTGNAKGGAAFSDGPMLNRKKERAARYYVLRKADSLQVEAIEKEYAAALGEADIHIPFKVLKTPVDSAVTYRRGHSFPAPPPGGFVSETLRMIFLGTGGRRDTAAPPPMASGTRIKQGPEHRRNRDRIDQGYPGEQGPPGFEHRRNRDRIFASYPEKENSLNIEHVFLPPVGTMVSAEFSWNDYRWLVIREIAPQLLFSLVMILFISVSFYFMYRSLRMQQRLMLLKNDFVSNVTHELKTPVATASVAIEALRNFHILDNPTRTREYLEIAQHELNRLTLLTDHILKAAIFENNGIDLQAEKLDLKAVTGEVLASMKLVFEKQQAKVTFQTEGENFLMEGGKAHIVNMIYNLLDNALKYSPHNPQISILLHAQQGGLRFLICDNGIGIAPEYHKKVFEKFFRIPSGDIHTVKGHGLGLNYVAAVVKSHGGTIRLESNSGKGSSFTIYLPRNYEKN